MSILGTGTAQAITQRDIWELSQEINVDPAVIDGIGKTESAGNGWFPNGQIKILPEPHKFYEYLPKNKRIQAIKEGLATRSYDETKATGHYKRMTNGPAPRYALLEKWIAFDEPAAYMAISSGTFQLMGFNFKACGFGSAREMFLDFCASEAHQLRAFVNFVKSQSGGLTSLRTQDYDKIELLYNGGGQNGAYAKQMRINVDKARLTRWTNYSPSGVTSTTEPLIQTPKKASGNGTLKKGLNNSEVEEAQQRLIVWGYDIQPDGLFGKDTEDAIKVFQKDNGLTIDGRIGEETRKLLFSNPNTSETKKIEEAIKPVIVTETKKEAVVIVPKESKKPWWKDLGIGAFGTTIIGWITSLLADLEPWMKLVLLLIAILGIVVLIWKRHTLAKEVVDVIEHVRQINNEPATSA